MKKLFEDWRRFLLERKTDVLYEKIADYFYGLLQEHEKYFWKLTDNPQDYFELYFKNRAITKEEFSRYQELTSDDTVMSTYTKFYVAMTKFRVKATPQSVRPGVAADMSSNGEMRVFVNMRPENISSFVQNIHPLTFRHEIAHWLNSIRSGFKKYRSKGAGKSTSKSFNPKEAYYYANSTEEIQSRAAEVFDIIKKVISREIPENPEFPDDFTARDFQNALRERNPKMFIKHAIENYGYDYFLYHLLTEKNKRRIVKRFYEMYNHFVAKQNA